MIHVGFNDLRRQYMDLRGEIDAAVEGVLASGWSIHGHEHAAVEEDLAAYLGVACCVGVANGTDALMLALVAVGCEPGDEVVTAANAGMYTTNAALSAGLTPRFADV